MLAFREPHVRGPNQFVTEYTLKSPREETSVKPEVLPRLLSVANSEVTITTVTPTSAKYFGEERLAALAESTSEAADRKSLWA